jgi:hypothetical protein
VSKYPLYILCPINPLTLSSSDNLRLSSQASGALLICGECFDEGEGDICFMLAEQEV